VDADGSANFYVPADKNIFFQALDENYMEVQQERTYINYRPGEVSSCIGCHEKKGTAPPTYLPTAITRAPDMPGPQPGEATGARELDYPTDVEPIIQQYCVSCHSDYTDRIGVLFSESYEALIYSGAMGPLLNEDHDTSGCQGTAYEPPYTRGSHASPLIMGLHNGTICNNQTWQQIGLSQEEWIRLITFVDSKAQYHGSWLRAVISDSP
jgi:hypothetical protein